jgi:hypothetical protein
VLLAVALHFAHPSYLDSLSAEALAKEDASKLKRPPARPLSRSLPAEALAKVGHSLEGPLDKNQAIAPKHWRGDIAELDLIKQSAVAVRSVKGPLDLWCSLQSHFTSLILLTWIALSAEALAKEDASKLKRPPARPLSRSLPAEVLAKAGHSLGSP